MADLDNTIRAIKLMNASRDRTARAGTATPEALTRPPLLTFGPGDRVLDLVTGQQGTVTDGRRTNIIVPATTNASS